MYVPVFDGYEGDGAEGRTVIESITTHRDEQPGFEAIYILMPTTENIGRVIRDFDGKRQYAAAHIFFIEGTDANIVSQLGSQLIAEYSPA
jgi:syntaxin-binding protein 1